MSDTDLLEVEFLKIKLGKATALTLPLAPHIALFTTMPAENGTGGVEVSTSGTGYARQPATAKYPTPSTGAVESGRVIVANNVAIDFGTATANWGTIVGAALMTTLTGGSALSLTDDFAQVSVVNGQPVVFAIGSLIWKQG